LLVGVYESKELVFVAKAALKALQIAQCPFKNLPEKRASRWGEALTAEKMKECDWLKPKLVCQVAFVEWTEAWHLRHCTFVAMRGDKACGGGSRNLRDQPARMNCVEFTAGYYVG
jgi:ATP-dependent DNA ligase